MSVSQMTATQTTSCEEKGSGALGGLVVGAARAWAVAMHDARRRRRMVLLLVRPRCTSL